MVVVVVIVIEWDGNKNSDEKNNYVYYCDYSFGRSIILTLKELQRATYRRPHDGDEADAAFRVAIIAGSVALVDVVIICDADVDANAGATSIVIVLDFCTAYVPIDFNH